MVVVGFLTYGLGIAPAYYGLSIFASSLIADLDLTRQQIGQMFGAFTFAYGLVSPVAAAAIRRWGIRATVTAGALCAASGFWLVSQAESAAELYVGLLARRRHRDRFLDAAARPGDTGVLVPQVSGAGDGDHPDGRRDRRLSVVTGGRARP